MQLGRLAQRTVLLIGAQGVALLALLTGQMLIKRGLGIEEFGHYAYVVAIFMFTGLFFDLGAGPAAGRLLALDEYSGNSADIARAFVRWMRLPLLVVPFVNCSAVYVAHLFVGDAILIPGMCAAVVSSGYCLSPMMMMIMRGRSDLAGLAFGYAGGHLATAIMLVMLRVAGWISLSTALVAASLAMAGNCLLLLRRAGAFGRVDPRWKRVLDEAIRAYGRKIWIGRLSGTGGFILDVPLLGLFGTAADVGGYVIVKTVVNPAGHILASINELLYRKFANERHIDIRLQRAIWGLSIASVMSIGLLGETIAVQIYAIEPGSLAFLFQVQAIAAGLNGAYAMYNCFLGAHGAGRALFVGGTAFGIVAAISTLSLAWLYLALGACIANVVSNGFWLCYCIYQYRKLGDSEHITSSEVAARQADPASPPVA